MKNRVWKLGLAALGGAFVACSGGSGTGTAGSSMETENSIALSVRLSDGTPAARMKIFVRPEGFVSGSEGIVADSIMNASMNFETDDNGVVEFNSLETGKYIIEARGVSMKGITKLNYEGQDSGSIDFDMNVKEPGSVSGQVYLPKGVSSVSVGIKGLEYRVQTDSLGMFEFESLPAGDLKMVAFVYDDSTKKEESKKLTHYGEVSVKLESGDKENVFIADSANMPKMFMFEDFENGVDDWYVATSKYATGKLDVAEAGAGRKGSAAHFVCSNDSNANWALIGKTLDGKIDMSELDSIVLWVRGIPLDTNRKFEFSFAFDVVADSADADESGKAWGHYIAKTEWTRYAIIPSKLEQPDSSNTGGNIGWDSVKTHVNKISFFGGVGGEFWIDDIQVFGMSSFVSKETEKSK